MELIESNTFARAGAQMLADAIRANPAAVIVVATGNTPMGIYRELATMYQAGSLRTDALRVVQLDAYAGITAADRRSLFRWMLESFCVPLAIPAAQIIRLAGDTADHDTTCRAYAATVRALGGIDLAILGLGPNGHLGFNEPPAPADAPTRLVDLTEESLISNAAYWGGRDQVPRQALTCGMDLLLAARQTLLVVAGAHKHAVLMRTLHGPVTPELPASFLQTAPHVTVLADRAAAVG